MSIWNLANPQLRDLKVYEPGKPIEETARELNVAPGEITKLASNENPLGPSPKALIAMGEALANSQLYPDGGGFYLRNALAQQLGLARENIILGNGSNEIIELLCHTFLDRDAAIITPRYAFVAYKIIATLFGAHTIETAAPKFEQSLDAILDAITDKTRLIFIANPNNPTGTIVSPDKVDRFIAQLPERVVVAFDEAYFEFLQEPPDTLRHVRDGRNIVVLRTFSKIHGLAGLRVGYGIAHPDLIQALEKTREPFNVNSIAQVGALAALADQAHQNETKRVVNEGRIYLENEFRNLKLEFVPGVANFIMVNVGDGVKTFQQMLARKVIVRPLKGYNLLEWIRITIGTTEQNQKCVAALKEVLANQRA